MLANECFAAVGGAMLAALAESGLSARRVANVLSWFVVTQLSLGPWRSRGEVRPAALAERMGVSRWTEWRARRDAASAGVMRDWSFPDPEARDYGRGAVRVSSSPSFAHARSRRRWPPRRKNARTGPSAVRGARALEGREGRAESCSAGGRAAGESTGGRRW